VVILDLPVIRLYREISIFIDLCCLESEKEPENLNNNYNGRDAHNFRGRFCKCDKEYSAEDSGDMYQCFSCQDWFHDSCIGSVPDPNRFEELICDVCVGEHLFLQFYFGSQAKVEVCASTESKYEERDSSFVFLGQGWRSKLCKCEACLKLYKNMPYLLEEEQVYEPETDEDGNISSYESKTFGRSMLTLNRGIAHAE